MAMRKASCASRIGFVISTCAGDSLLIDRVHFAYERIPKLDVEELVLEEVPDIDYSVIGGLGNQIEAIRDAVELPSCTRNSSPSTSSRHQRGSCSTDRRGKT